MWHVFIAVSYQSGIAPPETFSCVNKRYTTKRKTEKIWQKKKRLLKSVEQTTAVQQPSRPPPLQKNRNVPSTKYIKTYNISLAWALLETFSSNLFDYYYIRGEYKRITSSRYNKQRGYFMLPLVRQSLISIHVLSLSFVIEQSFAAFISIPYSFSARHVSFHLPVDSRKFSVYKQSVLFLIRPDAWVVSLTWLPTTKRCEKTKEGTGFTD